VSEIVDEQEDEEGHDAGEHQFIFNLVLLRL